MCIIETMNSTLFKVINLDVHMVHFLHDCNKDNHFIPWRRIYDYEILFVVDGEICVKTDKELYTVTKNQVHIMPPFVYHTRFFNTGKQCSYYGIHLDMFQSSEKNFSIYEAYVVPTQKMHTNWTEKSEWLKRKKFDSIVLPKVFDVKNTQALASVFQKMINVYKSHDEGKFLLLKSYAYQLIYQLIIEAKLSNIEFFDVKKILHKDIIDECVEYLNTNYTEQIDVDNLANKFGLSKNHFSKIFKKMVGYAPLEYLINIRIQKAKELILENKYYINEISAMVGYEDYAYFSRLFKKKEGISPKNFILLNNKTEK